MLKQRVITAVVLAALFIAGLFLLTPFYFSILIAVLLCQGAWEWTGLMKMAGFYQRVICYIVFMLLLLATWYFLHNNPELAPAIFIAAASWWVFAFILVMIYPRGVAIWDITIVKGLMGAMILLPTWAALICLQASESFGPGYVLFLIVLISAADIGAYFSGRLWGKTKLAPNVSPGKTIEGVAGGFVAVVFCAVLGAYLLDVTEDLANGSVTVFITFIILSLITAIFSILGDLTESMVKRQAGVKDSGTILPGHGGLLDRIDSATAAAPIFVLGLWGWFGLSMDLSRVG